MKPQRHISYHKLFSNYKLRLCGVLVISFCGVASAQGFEKPFAGISYSVVDLSQQGIRVGSRERAAELAFNEPAGDLSASLDDFSLTSTADAVGRKSPFKAWALSFVLPGLGQFYNGSHPGKVAAFVAAEAGFWALYSSKHNKANDQVATFEAFADKNWSEAEYRRYLQAVFGDSSDVGVEHTHHLPDSKTQQYYEMVGKYNQFSYGWAPAEGQGGIVYDQSHQYDSNPFFSPLRLQYNQMRADANDLFADRDRALTFVIVNHLLSSVDAAISAVRHNKNLTAERPSLSVRPGIRPDVNWAIIPEVYLSWSF